MISMKDIARECEVSVAAVSKALNDHSDISAEKKELIKKTAKEMGYTVNAAAKALKTNRSYNIGVLFADQARSGLTHDYFSYVLDSFKRNVEIRGYDLTFMNGSGGAAGKMSYLEHSRYRRFDGVLIACIDFNDPSVLELVLKAEIPVVSIDHFFDNRIAIMSDNANGMKDLLTYIYGMGHRQIAYIHGEDSAVTKSRVSSFYITAEKLGLEVPENYDLEIPYRNTAGAYEATLQLLDLKNPPTCIIYPDDFASFGGVNAIRERGLSIPDDISIAGYDGIRVGRHIKPNLTTMRQDTEGLGRAAAEKLIDLIERPRTTLIEQVIIKGELFKGDSVKNINQ